MGSVNASHIIWKKLLFVATVTGLHFLAYRWLETPDHSLSFSLAYSFLFSSLALFLSNLVSLFHPLRVKPRMGHLFSYIVLFIVTYLISSSTITFLSGIHNASLLLETLAAITLANLWYVTELLIWKLMIIFHHRINALMVGSPQDAALISEKFLEFNSYPGLVVSLYSRSGFISKDQYDVIVHNKTWEQDKSQIEYDLIQMTMMGLPIIELKKISEEFDHRVDLELNTSSDMLSYAQSITPAVKSYVKIKTILEPIIAFFMIVILAPIFVVTAILVRISSPGPIVYSQRRLGLGGTPFNIYKFRTMKQDAEATGVQWASGEEDPRITPIGKWLRKLHLDELPQLWNILVGDVSFVGPRPERPEFYEQLAKEIPLFYLRTAIRPGVTGWAQVCAGYTNSVEGSKLKLSYDLYYFKNLSFKMDLQTIVLTFVHVFRKIAFGEQALKNLAPSNTTETMPTVVSSRPTNS